MPTTIDADTRNYVASAGTDRTSVRLEGHGLFIARTSEVQAKLRQTTKRELINEIRGLWPAVFSRKELNAYPTYVLATILVQI